MPRTPIVPVRVDDETKERWTLAAKAARMSLSEFVRMSVNEQLDGSPIVTGRDVAARKKSTASKKECDRSRFHRPGTFCKGCGTVPA